jgi:phenylalanyl-tRNA synthetase beta chain
LLTAARYNLNRQQSRIRLFETGLSFVPAGNDLPTQQPLLAGLIAGRRFPESWSETGETVDYYDLKGDLESLLSLCGNVDEFTFSPGGHPALHPGQSATIYRNGENVGYLGAIHPELQKKLDLSVATYVFEVKLSGITSCRLPKFTELSKFPEIRRDLAILIGREVNADTVLATVKEAAGSYLQNLRLFDIYQGEGIDLKEKSLALGLTFQHSSRTLNEDEINAAVDNVVGALKEKLGATLRN